MNTFLNNSKQHRQSKHLPWCSRSPTVVFLVFPMCDQRYVWMNMYKNVWICIKILGWPKRSFKFSITSYGKTRMNILANPIEAREHGVLESGIRHQHMCCYKTPWRHSNRVPPLFPWGSWTLLFLPGHPPPDAPWIALIKPDRKMSKQKSHKTSSNITQGLS